MIDITGDVRHIVEKIRALPGAMDRASKATMEAAAQTIRRIMSRPGLPVRYPINWDTPKQKRYVLAKLRREKNLPYRRTGDTEQAWGYRATALGATVENIGHKAVFMYGTPSGTMAGAVNVTSSGQSHIHQGRWRLIRDVLDAVLARLPDEVLDLLKIEANK